MSIRTQAKEVGGSFDFPSITPNYYSQESYWREFFPKEKDNWYITCYPKYGSLTSGALRYLHVGNISGRCGFKPRMVPGHGWVECGSSQVIWLSEQRSKLSMNLLILCVWVCRVSIHWNNFHLQVWGFLIFPIFYTCFLNKWMDHILEEAIEYVCCD